MATPTIATRQPIETRRRNPVARILLWLLALIVLILIAASLWSWWRIRAALPQLDGSVQAPGLAAPVDVLRDARGVPHLRAQSLDDLYFAQGYVTAQDRLWQLDLSRRLAKGELAEIFGKRLIERDVENRKLGFRVAAERGVDDLPPDTRHLLSSYASGVNAFIETHRNRLPIEFVMLGYQPTPWREADSIAVALNMAKMLNTSWPGDLEREQVRARLSPELYADLFPQDSPLEHPVAEPVAGPAHAVPAEDARAVTAEPAGLASSDVGIDPVLDALESTSSDDLVLGSNNWVISGAHTASGKPLLSNDPHIAHSVPSVWYMIHLEAPGMDVSGVSLPGAPTVIIGHNQRIAWGMTNTGPDVQDLYVEQFNPANLRQYLHNGQWVDAELREEIIKVRGSMDDRLIVRVTRHGPIISNQGERPLALSWTALQPHALQFPFVAINQAQNWQDFTKAIRSFTGPEQNMVYADVDGNIGYYAPAWVPIRRSGDGSVPEPGATDDYDWIGYVPFDDLPHTYNPAGGIIATANSHVIPPGYPYYFTDAWAAPFRTARIFDLLEAGTPGRQCEASQSAAAPGSERPPQQQACFTVDDMLKIDMDIHPLDDAWLAPALVRAAAAHPPDSDEARKAIDLLQHWNGEAAADSPVPLICHDTMIALRERVLRPKIGDDLAHRNWSLSTILLEKVIDQQLARWLPPGDADFNATLMASLDDGLKQIGQRVKGRDPGAWRWGDTIPLTFHHPLDALPIVGRFFDVGPFTQRGTANCVKATTPYAGPSMRMVVDFSDFDNSVQNLTLGESGEVSSPYYADQFQAWYTGHSFPMLFSDAAVDRGAVRRLTLKP